MITHDQVGTDEDLAREVIVVARSIAPCIASFLPDSEEQLDAIAILRRVYAEARARGSRLVQSQRIGPASVEYRSVRSAFEGDAERALRALCSTSPAAGLPVGSFPRDRPISRLWPEG